MRKQYVTPELEYVSIDSEDVLGASATITDVNGDHMQSWWGADI